MTHTQRAHLLESRALCESPDVGTIMNDTYAKKIDHGHPAPGPHIYFGNTYNGTQIVEGFDTPPSWKYRLTIPFPTAMFLSLAESPSYHSLCASSSHSPRMSEKGFWSASNRPCETKSSRHHSYFHP